MKSSSAEATPCQRGTWRTLSALSCCLIEDFFSVQHLSMSTFSVLQRIRVKMPDSLLASLQPAIWASVWESTQRVMQLLQLYHHLMWQMHHSACQSRPACCPVPEPSLCNCSSTQVAKGCTMLLHWLLSLPCQLQVHEPPTLQQQLSSGMETYLAVNALLICTLCHASSAVSRHPHGAGTYRCWTSRFAKCAWRPSLRGSGRQMLPTWGSSVTQNWQQPLVQAWSSLTYHTTHTKHWSLPVGAPRAGGIALGACQNGMLMSASHLERLPMRSLQPLKQDHSTCALYPG